LLGSPLRPRIAFETFCPARRRRKIEMIAAAPRWRAEAVFLADFGDRGAQKALMGL